MPIKGSSLPVFGSVAGVSAAGALDVSLEVAGG
jgi:hypothetical protein